MKELFQALAGRLAEGRACVLVSVTASSGSVPGGAGTHMLVGGEGRVCGTIGGGALEHHAEAAALAALAAGDSYTEGFTLRHDAAGDLGMVCGGSAEVFIQHIMPSADGAAFFARCAACLEGGGPAWLLLVPGGDAPKPAACAPARAGHANGWQMGLYTVVEGMLVLAEHGGEAAAGPAGTDAHDWLGRLGADDLEALTGEGAAAVQKVHTPLGAVYCQRLAQPVRVVVFGGGHIAQQLVPLLARLDFATAVFEDRPKFAGEHLFPGAGQVILGDFGDIAASLALKPEDYIVVVTRGHAADFDVERQVLCGGHAYVGVIGSRAKTASVNRRLLAAGIPAELLDTVHTPIGLSIGAKTPAEIAVSIAAELIQTRAAQGK